MAYPSNRERSLVGNTVVAMLIFDERYRASGRFHDSDAYYILVLLKKRGCLGAGRIAEELGIPKSSVHTIIDLLLEDGLVGYGNRGASVTDLGRAVLRAVPIIPLELDTGLALGECRQAVRIPDRADQITSGIPQVKLSNIMGAVGCTTWVVENGRLVMPPHKYYEYENHRELERLVAEGNLEEGDVFLVCGADSRRAARAAALFVALDLF